MTTFRNLRDVVAGDDVSFTLKLIDESGSHVNAVGDNLHFTLQADMDIEEEVVSIVYTVPDDADGQNGIVHIPVTNEDMSIPAGTYNYDFLWIKTSSNMGKRETLFLGKIKIVRGVTG